MGDLWCPKQRHCNEAQFGDGTYQNGPKKLNAKIFFLGNHKK
jgi:hypothetical protein